MTDLLTSSTDLAEPKASPAGSGALAPRPFLTIRPRRGWAALNLGEVWRFRDLLLTLAGRDITLRYRQTALGIVWVILQPLLAAGIFSLVFGKIARLDSAGIPYFVFSYGGLLGYNAFASTLSKASVCLIGNSQLISKVYFPRLILPLSTVFSSLIDFAVALAMLIVLMVAYRVPPHPAVLLLPLWLALLLLLAIGLGLYASALTVSYRDVQYVLPVLVQLFLYVSPVAYRIEKVQQLPALYQKLYFLNPLAGLIQGFRWSLFGIEPPTFGHVAYAIGSTMLILLAGAVTFKRMERRFADVI